MQVCIFCDKENTAISIEHIVSESLGNEHYLMERGRVCDACNNRFAKFEGEALSHSILTMQRASMGIRTKQGKSVNGKVAGLEIRGHKDFKKHIVQLQGLNEKNVLDFDPKTQTFKLFVNSFDKSPVPNSKLLLKMGLEALYTSQRAVFKKHSFEHLKDYLANRSNKDWPFLTSGEEFTKFTSIPRHMDKVNLKRIRTELKFSEVDEHTLLFKFAYAGISMTINLLDRNLAWTIPYLDQKPDHVHILYPEHYRRKAEHIKASMEAREGGNVSEPEP